jgi:hypothetical protein
MATARKVAALPQWRITMIGKKGTRFGLVEAVDAESAIKIAAEKFGIPDPRRRRRLVATHASILSSTSRSRASSSRAAAAAGGAASRAP